MYVCIIAMSHKAPPWQSKLKSKQIYSFKVPLKEMTDVPSYLPSVECEHLVHLPSLSSPRKRKEIKRKEKKSLCPTLVLLSRWVIFYTGL